MKIFNKTTLNKVITIRNLNLAVILFIIAFVSYALFAPLTPSVYKNIVIQNSTSLESGGILTYSLDRCRYVTDNVSTQVIRNLVATDKNGKVSTNAFTISLSSDLVATGQGCAVSTRSLLLPSNIPQGDYSLRIVSIYSILPLRKPTTVSIISKPFLIQPPTIAEQVEILNQQINLLRESIANTGKTNLTNPTNPALTPSQSGSSVNSTNNSTGGVISTPPASTGAAGSTGGGSDSPVTTPVSNPAQNLINSVTGGLQGILNALQ